MKNKQMMIGVGVLIIVLVVIGFFTFHKTQTKKTTNTENVLPQSDDIPAVDSSVKVNLVETKKGQEVTLSVDNVPSGTQTLEYELAYDAKGPNGEDLPKGAVGSPIPMEGKTSITRAILLGTCSSGACIYDKGVTKIHVSLIFTGSYGKRSFAKDYTLE